MPKDADDRDHGQYGDLAEWYDPLYEASGKDYVAEAEALLEVAAEGGVVPRTLLDVACGTGAHLAAFARHVDQVVGVDVAPAMLDVARRRLPDVPLHDADMRTLDLGDARFDIVTCLFSAIGHVEDADELDQAIARMAAHVAPGGLLLVEPWLTPQDINGPARSAGGHRFLDTAETADGVVARASRSHLDGGALVLEFGWSVADDDGVRVQHEQFRMPLFDRDRLLLAVEHAGLDASWADVDELKAGRGLLIGSRPA